MLFLCNVVPYPPDGGVHLRIFNLLKRVAEKHEVVVGAHSWDESDEAGAAWMTRNGMRTVTGRLVAGNWRHAIPALRALLTSGQPPEVVQYQAPELRKLIATERFDVIQVEETILAPYLDYLPKDSTAKTVITFHNIHYVQARRIAQIEQTRWTRLWRHINGLLMKRFEAAIARRFDRNIVVSEPDRALLADIAPRVPIDVLPNGVDTEMLALLPEPTHKRTLLFVGTLNYRPCIDAVLWMAQEILPLLRTRYPDLEFWIVGKLPPREIEDLAGNGIFVTGHVPDVTPYYRRATVSVVPLRAGGGSRLKILEAMSLGRPVVSTTIGAEGLEVVHQNQLLLADDAEAFAEAVSRLFDEEELWRSLVDNARRHVVAHHDWEAIAQRQLEIYDELVDGT